MEARLLELISLHQRGVLDADELRAAKAAVLQSSEDAARAAAGLPVFQVGETSTGLPMGATVVMGAGATVMIGGGTVASLQLQSPAPQLQLAMAPAGPTAAQLAAQQQLDALKQTQAAQLEQLQQQMQEQMAAAQAAVSAAAPAPVAAPHVQFREQAARRGSSGEKKAAAPAAAAAPAVAAPKKASSAKQSTDLDSKAKSGSGGTEKRAIVVMFCDICDSTAMSEELDAEDVREVVLVYQQFVGEVLVSLGGHIARTWATAS